MGHRLWYKKKGYGTQGYEIKVGLSLSKKICVICFIESRLKMIRNVFYFILKTLIVLKVFTFLS